MVINHAFSHRAKKVLSQKKVFFWEVVLAPWERGGDWVDVGRGKKRRKVFTGY